ncbi:DsbA family protein, partial [Bacteriovoracaceae bacterium]|nr:DsbA family protein [Bacteriovoracaceae bacterium]
EDKIYEAEQNLYLLKLNKIKAMVLKKFMEADPKFKGMSNDAYLDKYIANNVKVSDKAAKEFAKKNNIPAESLNDALMGRIKDHLLKEEKKKAVDVWLSKQMAKNPVEVYLKKPTPPIFEVNVDGSPSLGPKDAKVTIVEFSDFQCPFCKKGADVLHALKKKYGNKVRFVFKNFPLPFHNHAQKAAEAGMCAFEQSEKAFWFFHDEMFANQNNLNKEGLLSMAKKGKLNEKKFADCLNSGKYTKKVNEDMKQGKDVSVKSTPTFFVNGMMVAGAQDIEFFSELIDEQLEK